MGKAFNDCPFCGDIYRIDSPEEFTKHIFECDLNPKNMLERIEKLEEALKERRACYCISNTATLNDQMVL